MKLSVTDAFYNGFNTNGTTAPTGDAAIFVQNATSDNFFCNGAVWGSVAANPEAIITLSGMNPAKYYTFTVFASRTGVTNIRDAKYTFTGASGAKSANLNASNNASNVAVVIDVVPNADGTVVFKSEPGPDNNSAEKFFFLGAMKIKPADNPTSVESVKANETLKVFYTNQTLRLGDYTGQVKVYNLTGGLIAEGQSVFGYMPVKLSNGVYVVSTTAGNAKLIVR